MTARRGCLLMRASLHLSDLDWAITETITMPALVYLNAVAFVSSQNHPILIRTFGQERENNKDIKYHYIAHTSLDVFEERSQSLSV